MTITQVFQSPRLQSLQPTTPLKTELSAKNRSSKHNPAEEDQDALEPAMDTSETRPMIRPQGFTWHGAPNPKLRPDWGRPD